jgi:ribonuclease D
MIFTDCITKEEIAKLPKEEFPGRVVVVNTFQELNEAILYLSSCTEIGFDTETRPSFVKNTPHKTALVQLSGNDTCYLIRLSKFRYMPAQLKAFLNNNKVKKIGLSLRDDLHGLNCLTRLTLTNYIDLQEYVTQFGIKDMSLQKIYAILFGKRISKNKNNRLSNWEANALTKAQIYYAALDAWSCLRIYQFLEQSK